MHKQEDKDSKRDLGNSLDNQENSVSAPPKKNKFQSQLAQMGSGVKTSRQLQLISKSWTYWYYYSIKVCDQYGKTKFVQMEALSA